MPATPPSGGVHHTTALTGLKRGFLSGKASCSNPTTQQAATSTSAAQELPHGGESQLQQHCTSQTSQPAFTGRVVEHVGLPTHSDLPEHNQALAEPLTPVQYSSDSNPDVSRGGQTGASCSGQGEQKVPTRRLSKFKQSRNAK